MPFGGGEPNLQFVYFGIRRGVHGECISFSGRGMYFRQIASAVMSQYTGYRRLDGHAWVRVKASVKRYEPDGTPDGEGG